MDNLRALPKMLTTSADTVDVEEAAQHAWVYVASSQADTIFALTFNERQLEQAEAMYREYTDPLSALTLKQKLAIDLESKLSQLHKMFPASQGEPEVKAEETVTQGTAAPEVKPEETIMQGTPAPEVKPEVTIMQGTSAPEVKAEPVKTECSEVIDVTDGDTWLRPGLPVAYLWEAGIIRPATVVAVHNDDLDGKYCTILLEDGTERQTVIDKLEPLLMIPRDAIEYAKEILKRHGHRDNDLTPHFTLLPVTDVKGNFIHGRHSLVVNLPDSKGLWLMGKTPDFEHYSMLGIKRMHLMRNQHMDMRVATAMAYIPYEFERDQKRWISQECLSGHWAGRVRSMFGVKGSIKDDTPIMMACAHGKVGFFPLQEPLTNVTSAQSKQVDSIEHAVAAVRDWFGQHVETSCVGAHAGVQDPVDVSPVTYRMDIVNEAGLSSEHRLEPSAAEHDHNAATAAGSNLEGRTTRLRSNLAASAGNVHEGYTCDRSGISPIVGMRYTLTDKE